MPRPNAPRPDAAELDAAALEFRAIGLSFREIARRLDTSVATAHKRVMRGLNRTRQEPADKLRRLEAERLDRLLSEAFAVLCRPHYYVQSGKVVTRTNLDTGAVDELLDDGPTLAAIGQLVRLGESRRKLLGLDAPMRLDARVDLRVAWERASPEERMDLLDFAIVELQKELAQLGPPTSPAAETIPPDPPAAAGGDVDQLA